MSYDQLDFRTCKALIDRESPKSHGVKLAGLDADGIMRGKVISRKKFDSIGDSSFGFCSVIFGWDMHDFVYPKELKVSNLENGYQDLKAVIDLSSLRFLGNDRSPFFFVSFFDPITDLPIAPCPRNLLKVATDKIRDDLKCESMSGLELEFFHYRETAKSLAEKKGQDLEEMTPGMFGYSITRPLLNEQYYYKILEDSELLDLDVEGFHTETGPGVYEAAIGYTKACRVADNSTLFKMTCKTVGAQFGIMPCFMAKPKTGLPGNSGHIHVSLIKDGVNLFAREEKDPNAPWPDVEYFSDLGRHFLAGILEGLPDIMPVLAPNINSYKRLVDGYWAPVTVSWGYESRLASIRLIAAPSCPAKATRLEIRVPGADVNPHYALAALFALGYRGIKNKIPLTLAPMGKNPSMSDYEKLPRSLESAVDRFSSPKSIAREVLGNDFVDHFAGTRVHEIEQFRDAVTTWEVQRYIETV